MFPFFYFTNNDLPNLISELNTKWNENLVLSNCKLRVPAPYHNPGSNTITGCNSRIFNRYNTVTRTCRNRNDPGMFTDNTSWLRTVVSSIASQEKSTYHSLIRGKLAGVSSWIDFPVNRLVFVIRIKAPSRLGEKKISCERNPFWNPVRCCFVCIEFYF